MPAPDNIRKNFNLFLDGFGYAGQVEEFTPPALTVTEEDYRGGGLDAPIGVDMGMEKLTCSFKITKAAAEAFRLWGVTGRTVPLIVRGSIENAEGVEKPEVFRIRGKIPGLEFDALTAGGKPGYTFTMSPTEYAYVLDGVTVFDIDVPNMKRVINGVDQLAQRRVNLGLA